MSGAARNEWGIVSSVFLSFLGTYFMMPFIPLYVGQLGDLNATQTALWSGAILGVTPLIAGLTAPLWGMLADRFGRKRMLQRSLIAYTLCLGAMGLATAPWHLFAIRAVEGFVGAFTASAAALVSTTGTPERLSIGIGRVHAARVLGMALGPLPGALLADYEGYRVTCFAAMPIVFGGYLLVTLLVREDKRRALIESAQEGAISLRTALINAPFLAILLAVLVTRVAERSFEPVLPLLVAQAGTGSPAFATATITTAGLIASSVAAVAIGYVGLRWRFPVLVAILFATAVVFLPALAFTSWAMLLLLRTLAGLLLGASLTLAISLAAINSPIEHRGAALGLVGSATAGGSSLGYFVAGALSPIALSSVFAVDALIVALSALFLIGTRRRHLPSA